MIGLATSRNPPFKKIYCLDTSRFGRDQHETQVILYELRRKHGIEVIFTNMPHTGTYLDPAFEAIMSAFDYIHSQQSKAKGIASMKQNIRKGYRAGGRAPYGYMLETEVVGKHRNGETITKTRLKPNPETRDFAREYFERRARFENRRSILNDFYKRGIPSPTGRKIWSPATARSLEDNIDVYLGHTVFNRHNERVKIRGKLDGYAGRKNWKDREEWVIHENTHDALISQEVAERIKEMKRKGIRQSPFNRRVYPLRRRFLPGLCKRAGVKPFGFHALRRWVAQMLADKHKQSTQTVQRFLRHKNVRTTEIYLENLNKDLRPAANLLDEKIEESVPDLSPKSKGGNDVKS